MSLPEPDRHTMPPVGGVTWRATAWWDTYERDDLAHWLDGNGRFDGPSDAIQFYQEPWRWSAEFLEWKAEMRNEELGEAA